MAFLTIAEFQLSSGLSDRALMCLLGSPGLTTSQTPQGVLTIDVDSAAVIKARELLLSQDQAALQEQASEIRLHFGDLIRSTVEEVIDEALRRLKERAAKPAVGGSAS